MKTEYIALSPQGFAATFIAGVFVGITVHAASVASLISSLAIAFLLALHVRTDARRPIPNGTYRHTGLLAWSRVDEPTEQRVEPAKLPRQEGRVIH